ncbi:uncharacterized protein N7479_005872 [Penicillium vulpinum]|nr:uncharacterized protein N7479_005872 [Penicillium vulpinum]KAJ5958722.1 hypothetical protein N7479_005872 [Penicillium vulpinum]
MAQTLQSVRMNAVRTYKSTQRQTGLNTLRCLVTLLATSALWILQPWYSDVGMGIIMVVSHEYGLDEGDEYG